MTHLGIISEDTFSISEKNQEPSTQRTRNIVIFRYIVELILLKEKLNHLFLDPYPYALHNTWVRTRRQAVASNCDGVLRLSHSTLHRHSTQRGPSATEKTSTKSICWASIFFLKGFTLDKLQKTCKSNPRSLLYISGESWDEYHWQKQVQEPSFVAI